MNCSQIVCLLRLPSAVCSSTSSISSSMHPGGDMISPSVVAYISICMLRAVSSRVSINQASTHSQLHLLKHDAHEIN